MLEKMGAFFDSRLQEYDHHQLTCIESATEFYPFTAQLLPHFPGAKILDLGCGTGLELEEYFPLVPEAQVTGIDLAPGMLGRLRSKFPDKSLKLILGSYFDIPFGAECFDAAVSVESLHHFTQAEKIPLYTKLRAALKPGGYFILTDYFASTDEEEQHFRREYDRLRQIQSIPDGEFYHYDTPLTISHEIQALLTAGFSHVEIVKHWGATYTLKVRK